MTGKQAGTRRGINTWTVAGLALLVIAVVLISVGLFRDQSPPQPDAESDTRSATAETVNGGSESEESQAPSPGEDVPAAEAESSSKGMDASTPTRLTIPAIDVDTSIMELGLADGDELEVPPLGKDAPAGWYERSPTPGEVGPSLIVGHVDSAHDGPAVFYELGDLQPGDTINATRDDGSTAIFSVDDVTDYGKDDFPEYKVYGNTDDPEIRLITCGGDFNEQTGHYEDNIVVTGHLVRNR
ncbi:class F sortase [Brevibacterium marinum]|uniref:Sortase (Surface protein transpeptidase) n=1 Tax=Brevibacterium marinum TaxID=418643 RepID=A0A846RWP2_9MICO|nr:class F sortase [Brevibacterium marinum]NJC56386.1 sortase (surface protein transpeptidase) [Brevibacterium marinum]